MKNVQIPGAVWVIALALINTLPAALQDAYPGAAWVPLVVDMLLIAARAIQVYAKSGNLTNGDSRLENGTVVPVSTPAPVEEPRRAVRFLLG